MNDKIRQYGRDDVKYDSWYSEWSKQLARKYPRGELESQLQRATGATSRAARSHLRAVDATISMTSMSGRRAAARNSLTGEAEKVFALRGAIEIHDLFPEFAQQALAARKEG